jgi:hypothetical protein
MVSIQISPYLSSRGSDKMRKNQRQRRQKGIDWLFRK